MKKAGFTLSELLIALGVIAVLSVLVAPAVSNIMPDKNKTRILKYYSTVKNYTHDILDNDAIYYDNGDKYHDATTGEWLSTPTATCSGLSCTAQPLIPPYNDSSNSSLYSGTNKYMNIMKNMIFSDLSKTTLPDGSSWNFAVWNSGTTWKGYTITITMNSGGDNCSYSSTCKKPDIFIFKVDLDGNVNPGDALTDAFIKNPSNTNKKKDLDEAATLASNTY